MLVTTIDIIRSGLKADATLTPADRARILSLLRNSSSPQKSEPAVPDKPRLIRRAEAAQRLSCSLRMVDKLAADGVLQKHTLPGRVRAAGFLESDVAALITGRAEIESVQRPAVSAA